MENLTEDQINAAANELWDWLGEGRSQNESMNALKQEVARIIRAALVAHKDEYKPRN